MAGGTAIAGAGQATNQSAPAPGSLFGYPMYGTQPRVVVDNGNSALGVTLAQGSQTPLNTTRLDQLDIVRGMKLLCTWTATVTDGEDETPETSPLFPANSVSFIQFQLQAAYNTMNVPGWLAAAFQAFRPSWGDRGLGASTPDNFAVFGGSLAASGDPTTETFVIDVPFAIKLDEYFDLTAEGVPANKYGESLVGVEYMAAQSKVIVPTITFAAGISSEDLYNSPVAKATADTTSTFTDAAVTNGKLYRDAFWTGQSPAGNPPEYAWIYTRDYFVQPTQGQGQVNALIQNTGVSVGQVLSLVAMIWDPAGASGYGAPVPITSIQSWQLITGGTLQNWATDPLIVEDRMRSLYGKTTAGNLIAAGIFVFDFCLSEDGSYLSNANAINTYVVNGVQLSAIFKSGDVPGSSAKMYVGVEALKMATS